MTDIRSRDAAFLIYYNKEPVPDQEKEALPGETQHHKQAAREDLILRFLRIMPDMGRMCQPPPECLRTGVPAAQARVLEYLGLHGTATMGAADRRRVRVRLSPASQGAANSILEAYRHKVGTALACLKENELAVLVKHLKTVFGEGSP